MTKVIYPGNLEVCYEYDLYGNRNKIIADGNEIWAFKSNNGKIVTTGILGNFDYIHSVDNYGYNQDLKMIKHPQNSNDQIFIEYIHLEHDAATGNLISREDGFGLPRIYEYDEMDRLVSVSIEGNEILSMKYDNNGNILNKSNVGDYSYEAIQPHAVSDINNIHNGVLQASQMLSFNEIGKVASITEMSRKMIFDYGPDGQRWHSVLTDSSTVVRETVYSGNYEKITALSFNLK